MTIQRLTATARRDEILRAALRVAKREGFIEFTRDQVAVEAGCSTGTISTYYDIDGLKLAVLKLALKLQAWGILRGLLIGPYKGRIRITKEQKQQILQHIR